MNSKLKKGLALLFILLFIFLFIAAIFLGYIITNEYGTDVVYNDYYLGATNYDYLGDTSFILTKDGMIYKYTEEGGKEVLIDYTDEVFSETNEDGLLSMAFHPNFKDNHYVYIYYTTDKVDRVRTNVSQVDPLRTGLLVRFEMNNDEIDLSTKTVIFQMDYDSMWHRGGEMEFAPDGNLFISIGEDHQRENTSQNMSELKGKILRLDVDHPANGKNYGIPADNPYVGDNSTRDEIWAYGLRNPWRFSVYVDPNTDETVLFVGDVGEALEEEISVVREGKNYGWPWWQGNVCMRNCTIEDSPLLVDYDPPLIAYKHLDEAPSDINIPYGVAVIAGHVYTGEKFPELQGKFVFADYLGNAYALEFDSNFDLVQSEFLVRFPELIVDIEVDRDGELVFVGNSIGGLFKLAEKSIIVWIFAILVIAVVAALVYRRKRLKVETTE